MNNVNQRDPDITIIEHDNGFIMFFQANVNKYFTQRFQIKQAGHLL